MDRFLSWTVNRPCGAHPSPARAPRPFPQTLHPAEHPDLDHAGRLELPVQRRPAHRPPIQDLLDRGRPGQRVFRNPCAVQDRQHRRQPFLRRRRQLRQHFARQRHAAFASSPPRCRIPASAISANGRHARQTTANPSAFPSHAPFSCSSCVWWLKRSGARTAAGWRWSWPRRDAMARWESSGSPEDGAGIPRRNPAPGRARNRAMSGPCRAESPHRNGWGLKKMRMDAGGPAVAFGPGRTVAPRRAHVWRRRCAIRIEIGILQNHDRRFPCTFWLLGCSPRPSPRVPRLPPRPSPLAPRPFVVFASSPASATRAAPCTRRALRAPIPAASVLKPAHARFASSP
jgi:hypothetical protein